MDRLKILVFPCGSEIGLEIHRSLMYSRHVELIGGSSIEDHGRFVYENYIGGLPFVEDSDFEEALQNLIQQENIDAIYPTMDLVIAKVTGMADRLNCKVIGSPVQSNLLALSKKKTYQFFEGKIRVPRLYDRLDQILKFPVFLKPDIGYGSRGTKLIHSMEELKKRITKVPDQLILEFLPGEEYTVDCFSDRFGNLLFSKPRKRGRIQKGISVHTLPAPEIEHLTDQIAIKINSEITLRGAWFFQVKKDENGELSLLEIATRLGGSSALFRAKGINFALMSIFDAFDYPVSVLENDFSLEMDRSLNQRFKIKYEFDTVYVDLDDCLILGEHVNPTLVKFLYSSINLRKRIVLITKHEKDLSITLKKYRLEGIFDEVIHIAKHQSKADFITESSAIFIDDSYAERKSVLENKKIPVFAPDAVQALLSTN